MLVLQKTKTKKNQQRTQPIYDTDSEIKPGPRSSHVGIRVPGENLSKQEREPTTNSTHI